MFIEQIMVTPVITVAPDTPIERARAVMHEWRCRHLPVEADGGIVGIVSDRDLRAALASAPARAPGGPTVDAIMHRGVVTVTPRTSIEDASRELLAQKIGALPVMDRGRLVGIVTETDLLQLLVRMLGLLGPRQRLELELRAEAAFGQGALAAYSD